MPGFATIDTLIIVCCHAIWLSEKALKVSEQEMTEGGWLIEPFQAGETLTFIDHITTGIQQLSQNQSAVLVFSGGSTKPSRTQVSEGESYKQYAVKHGLLDSGDLITRTFSETDARDSFQNVLFSLLRFHQFVGQYYQTYGDGSASVKPIDQLPSPRKLVLISHGFKRTRFEELHLPALRYPVDSGRFQYIGVDPQFDDVKMQEIQGGDAKRGYGAWKDDIYGQGTLLSSKRLARGWTKGAKETFASSTKKALAETNGLAAEEEDGFKSIISFIENDSAPFPEKVPWS